MSARQITSSASPAAQATGPGAPLLVLPPLRLLPLGA